MNDEPTKPEEHILTVRIPKAWRKLIRQESAKEDQTPAEWLRGVIRSRLPDEADEGRSVYPRTHAPAMVLRDG